MPCYSVKKVKARKCERNKKTTVVEKGPMAMQSEGSTSRLHQESQAEKGLRSGEFMAMIHTAIPDGKVWAIPGAKEAV